MLKMLAVNLRRFIKMVNASGIFLLNNDQIRYEYYNDNLYTLLYLNEKMYVANNSERNKIQLLQ